MLILILSLLILNAQASESFTSYCFPTATRAQMALKDFNFIKLPQDKIRLNKECIEIFSTTKRISFYSTYIFQKFKDAKPSMGVGYNQANSRECRLEVTKNLNQKQEKIQTSLKKKSPIHSQSSHRTTKTTEVLAIASGRNGIIKTEDTYLYIGCTKTNKAYLIDIFKNDTDQSLLTSFTLLSGQSKTIGRTDLFDNQNDQILSNKKLSLQKNTKRQLISLTITAL
jgi:hypothetical protein